MIRCLSYVLASLTAFCGLACAQTPLGQLGALSQFPSHGRVYDGGALRPPSAVDLRTGGKSSPRIASFDYETLRELKAVLSEGTVGPGGPVLPFIFRFEDGGSETAQSAGLEGFLYAERGIVGARGQEAVAHHLQDYFDYLDALFAPVSWAQEARDYLRWIDQNYSDPREKYDKLMEFVTEYTASMRESVAAADAAAWARSARIYEIFPRAYNLEGKREARGSWSAQSAGSFFREFGGSDLADIRDKGFDTLWVMGIFPIGERGRSGTGGGSPYSIRDHAALNPELGTPDEFRDFVSRAHAAGLRVIIDFVPNHTSMDSRMLQEHPDYFIHRPAGAGQPPEGYFEHQDPSSGRRLWVRHGGFAWGDGRAYWNDTAQVDYSNPMLRREMIRTVKGWVEKYGVDGFRVDMAYLVSNAYFQGTWGSEMGGPPSSSEFLDELITEVKSQYPGTAFIAESYDRWDDLSRAGFDLIYGKNDMGRPGGHKGLYDAMVSRDPGRIRAALGRAAFLDWQQGGAGMLGFVGNHDEVSPARAFGSWMKGASFLTLLMPGSRLFYGSQEIGFDQPNEAEHKSIPFNVPVKVDWASADPDTTAFYDRTFREASELRSELGTARMIPLGTQGSPSWVGYLLLPEQPEQASLKGAAVLANPTDRSVEVRFREEGLEYQGWLEPYGYELVRF